MGSQSQQDQQDVGWIMRRAQELGHDPSRVSRALSIRPPMAGGDSGADKPAPHLSQGDAPAEDVRPGR